MITFTQFHPIEKPVHLITLVHLITYFHLASPNPDLSFCTECFIYLSSIGSYCPHSGMSQPLPCPMGQCTDVPGQSSCKICNSSVACPSEARTELQPSQRNRMPVSCPPGTHTDGEGPGCDVCPLGGSSLFLKYITYKQSSSLIID